MSPASDAVWALTRFLSRRFFYREDRGDTVLQTSILTTLTRRHTLEDGILHSHRHENLKYYIPLTGLIL
jgi:hypothetical protein